MVEATRTEPDSGQAAAWDVAVIGGGAAGLSGAVALARSRRSVLVVDAGRPRNASAAHLHNYLSRDGTAPSQLLATGRDEVTGYGGRIVTGTVRSATRPDGDVFRLQLDDGSVVRARRLLVATGLVDELPAVDGVAQRWGRDVLHCPYCHGWEVRDRAIGVLATRMPLAVEFALLWRQLSADVTLFRHTASALDDVQRERLVARGVRVVDGRVVGLEVREDRLNAVRLDDGRTVRCDALAVQPTFVTRADLLAGLGLPTTEQRVGEQVVGTFVAADDTGATKVPGVWVAGNVADVAANLIGAAAAGGRAAAAINADLVAEDTARALDRHRAARARTAVLDGDTVESYWDRFYAMPNPAWSGQANAVLVRETGDMAPGTALDLGCGEGADAIWLARQGWTVTAIDVARPALQRARERAVAAGVADRITWLREDLARWRPTGSFDLVSVHYLHSSVDLPRDRILRAAAAAVASDGVLIVVGHAGPLPDHADAEPGTRFPTPHEVLADLDLPPTQWRVERAADIPRDTPDAGADDHPHTLTDTVVRIRRLTPSPRA